MNEHEDDIERMLRSALHDAADHVDVAASTGPVVHSAGATGSRSNRRLLVPSLALVAAVAVVVGALSLRDGGGGQGVNVSVAGNPTREVPGTELPSSDADLVVFMRVNAADTEIAAVRASIEQSPDVAQFAYVDGAAAHAEFARDFCANPDLVNSVGAQDLPVSFRIMAVDGDAQGRLVTLFRTQPGVDSVTQPQTVEVSSTVPGQSCADSEVTVPAIPPPAPTTSPPPTLPPAGPLPDDPDAARAGVIAAFTQAWSGSNTVETRRAAMQDSEELAPLLDQARAGNTDAVNSMSVTVGDVTFLDPDRAAVLYHLSVAGSAQGILGYAVLDNGTWKVSRETVCSVLQLAGVTCPPKG